MKNKAQLKHDSICKRVSNELETGGWDTLINKEYSTHCCGEIDVIGYKDNYVIYVEVKTNLNYKNYKTAVKQLHRARKYCNYHKNKRLFTLIATQKQNEIKYEWLKNDAIR